MNTFIPLPTFAKDIILLISTGGLLVTLILLIKMRKALHYERYKRTVPLLMIKSSGDGFILENTSECLANHIHIQDIPMTLDYDFKKDIRLTFAPIDALLPHEEKPLTYQAYDGEHKIPREKNNKLFARLSHQAFNWHILYDNLAGIPFTATIEKTKEQFTLKETRPSNE